MDSERLETIMEEANQMGWQLWKWYREIHNQNESEQGTLAQVENLLYVAQHILVDCLEAIKLPF